MRLLLVELNRFRSRRAVVLILLAATLLTALIAASEIWDSRPVSATERAAAQARADLDAQRPEFRRELESCQDTPEQFLGPDHTAADCAELLTPKAAWYLSRTPLDIAVLLPSAGVAVILLVSALLVICGATFAGADWNTGSMGNQVLFEPRRTRVWVSKALAVLGSGLVAAAVIIGAFWVVIWLVADARGVSAPDRVWHEVWWYGARGTLLAGAGALGGYALTMLLRSTVGTLAVLFAYAVGGEALVLALPLERATQWSLANNVFAWISDGTEVFDPDIDCAPGTQICVQSYELGLWHGVGYLAVLLGVTLVVSALLFRRRDIP